MTLNDTSVTTAEENIREPRTKETGDEAVPPLRNQRPTGTLLGVGVVLIFACLIYSGIHARAVAEANLKGSTERDAIPTVNVVSPAPGAPTQEIVLPGTTQAFIDSPIHARTNGYLKKWHFDIGAHVRKGDLLAEIETPEIDQQLLQARAELDTAQANLNIAKITASRWQDLVRTGSVSQQETDQAVNNLNAVQATSESNAANVRRLEQLQSFEKIYAPFDGIITARNTDIGALIDAGANSPPKELFHITAINKLRLYVSVPEVYSRAARSGSSAAVTLDEFPGQTFQGIIVRNANSIDVASRTLLVEVDVDNPRGQLLPGAYVFVHLKLPDQTRSVTIPANTLIFRKEGLQVGLVRNGKAELVPIKINRDYGNTVEVISGLQPTDAVIIDPSDSLVSGEPVRLSGNGESAQ
ncbi:MAG TPA: efflux RND transporter periplasmic adaptor subunit [Candidatus Saccharimonadales bacterium]|nr:efflux RND transporter periplasmic adaptor subunit [Candidatus Saccharimonadales bacterium]